MFTPTTTPAPTTGGPLPTFEGFVLGRTSTSKPGDNKLTPALKDGKSWNSDIVLGNFQAFDAKVNTYPGPWPAFKSGTPKAGEEVACYYDQSGKFLGWTPDSAYWKWMAKVEPKNEAQYKIMSEGAMTFVTTTAAFSGDPKGLYKDNKAHAWVLRAAFDQESIG